MKSKLIDRSRAVSVRKQAGFTLIEGIITFVLVAVGLLALLNFNSSAMRVNADAKIRAEAINIGESRLEEMRGFISTGDYDASVISGSTTVNGDSATFTVTSAATGSGSLNVSVVVGWTDSNNDAQSITLATNIRRIDAATAGEDLRLAMLNTSGGHNWVPDADEEGEGGTDEGGGETNDPPVYEFPVDDPNWDTSQNAYKLTVSGDVDGNQGDLEDFYILTAVLSESNNQYPNGCVLTNGGNKYECTVFYGVLYQGWTGTITFTTRDYFCYGGAGNFPQEMNIFYQSMTDHVGQDFYLARDNSDSTSRGAKGCGGNRTSVVSPGVLIEEPTAGTPEEVTISL